jgi:hypothetical protein
VKVLLPVLALLLLGVRPAQAQSLGYDRVYRLAAEAIGHGPGAHYATRIAWCESRHDPNAYDEGFDRRYGVWYRHVGLFQVEQTLWGATAWRVFGGSLWEPRVNAGMMGLILKQQGWANGWPYCARHS